MSAAIIDGVDYDGGRLDTKTPEQSTLALWPTPTASAGTTNHAAVPSAHVSAMAIAGRINRRRVSRFTGSRGASSGLARQRRETQAQPERFEEAIEGVLRWIMTGVDRAQHVRAGHAHPGRELLDTHRPDHLP